MIAFVVRIHNNEYLSFTFSRIDLSVKYIGLKNWFTFNLCVYFTRWISCLSIREKIWKCFICNPQMDQRTLPLFHDQFQKRLYQILHAARVGFASTRITPSDHPSCPRKLLSMQQLSYWKGLTVGLMSEPESCHWGERCASQEVFLRILYTWYPHAIIQKSTWVTRLTWTERLCQQSKRWFINVLLTGRLNHSYCDSQASCLLRGWRLSVYVPVNISDQTSHSRLSCVCPDPPTSVPYHVHRWAFASECV